MLAVCVTLIRVSWLLECICVTFINVNILFMWHAISTFYYVSLVMLMWTGYFGVHVHNCINLNLIQSSAIITWLNIAQMIAGTQAEYQSDAGSTKDTPYLTLACKWWGVFCEYFFYASAFRRRRHYVFGLSVRPSVRSLKYPLLTCTWVRWSTRPTVTVLRHVRPSVRLSVRPSGEVSGHLPENAWREWPEILHADVSWPSSELISLWPWSVDFSYFGAILTWWNGSNLGFPGISRRMHGGNGLKFCTLMYLDHLQNWLVYGHGLLNFLILAQFWLSETGQIWGFRAFPRECMEEMASKFARWCILTTSRTD